MNKPLGPDEFHYYCERGTYGTEEVYMDALNMLPPINLHGGQGYFAGFQVGEPYCHKVDKRTGKWRPMFGTFTSNNGVFIYHGVNFAGEVDSREYAID